MRKVSLAEAQRDLGEVIDEVVAESSLVVITRADGPDVVIMSIDTFNSWRETMHLMKSPANAAHLTESINQLRATKQEPLSDP